MADVLLTHSYHLSYDPKQVRKMQPYPPLGTLYAAAILRQRGISVAVFDTMLKEPSSLFVEALKEHQPAVVVIYEDDFNFLTKMCLTRMRQVAFEMIEASRAYGARVVVHGSDATDQAPLYLQAGAEFVLQGESEIRLGDLVASMLLGRTPTEVPGLAWHDTSGAVMHHASPVEQANWMQLSTPARDLIDLKPYREAWCEAHGFWSLNIVASRGCPYRCNWCAKPISGDRFHLRPARLVAQELCELRTRFGADHAWFGDDVFALDHRWAAELADEVERIGVRVPFKVQSRADLMTVSTVDALRRAGCAEVWMGVESGSQKVLDAMEKGLKVEAVSRARKMLGEAGIQACYFLQLGYPGELWDEIQQTIALVRRTRPDDIGVSVSYPLPNTRFYEQVRDQLGAKRNWRDSDDLCVTFTAAYKNEFYLALRDALHAEVDSWSAKPNPTKSVAELWQRVYELEPNSRNVRPTELPDASIGKGRYAPLISADDLRIAREV
ncbi:Fe-S protein, radical SAM family [Candidatus Koribacter versatilis Ellin345]|uniref:Fe-S protein, radical SAM family n=1 Tax=Koribacter versatilis (strain Ellin345) TaxID=204669 RepID=Q1ITC2_KORVE|nr:radical SAM protein [Candidatus Koribacter versatilis]ABF39878.1 Fe-S protein, radical SAM family [Candidatus Koribacter versatilis Ellin345]